MIDLESIKEKLNELNIFIDEGSLQLHPEQGAVNEVYSVSSNRGKLIIHIAKHSERNIQLQKARRIFGLSLFLAKHPEVPTAEVITYGYGTPIFKQPIFQCDLKDTISGFTDYAAVNGVAYNLGNESGIVHYFVDNTVQNGRTYYYALVAYDFGFADSGSVFAANGNRDKVPIINPGITPSENNVVIELDESENIRVFKDGTLAIGQNVAIVTPHQTAAVAE